MLKPIVSVDIRFHFQFRVLKIDHTYPLWPFTTYISNTVILGIFSKIRVPNTGLPYCFEMDSFPEQGKTKVQLFQVIQVLINARVQIILFSEFWQLEILLVRAFNEFASIWGSREEDDEKDTVTYFW